MWCFFFFFLLFSHRAGPGALWGWIKAVVRDTRVVNLCFDWFLKTISCFSLTLKRMFLGRRSLTLSFTLSTWISLEQKHCHFIKCLLWCVFVSDSCYLRIGCHSCSTVEARCLVAHPLPALLRPALPVTLLLLSPFTVVQTPSSQEGRTQPGQTIGYHNPMNYGLKEASNSRFLGEDNTSLLRGPAQFDFHKHHLSTRWRCVRPFLYIRGFSNLVENACLSSVDSWVSEPLCWDACLPCTVLCCFLHSVKLM